MLWKNKSDRLPSGGVELKKCKGASRALGKVTRFGVVGWGLPVRDWHEFSHRFYPTKSGVVNPNPVRVKPCPNQAAWTK